jgi:hypothetical protein
VLIHEVPNTRTLYEKPGQNWYDHYNDHTMVIMKIYDNYYEKDKDKRRNKCVKTCYHLSHSKDRIVILINSCGDDYLRTNL